METRMVPPGDRARLRLRLRLRLRFAVPDARLLPALQANVWLWLHLGAIGRRSRRGYGSLLWEPHEGDLLDGFLEQPFDRWSDLESPERLEAYLKRGIKAAFEALERPLAEFRRSTFSNPSKTADFTFHSLDQVFVGGEILPEEEAYWHVARSTTGRLGPERGDSATSLESRLHGLAQDARGDELHRKQLGMGSSKPPSPMIWRVFPMPTADDGHTVVMTWSPVDYANGPDAPIPQIAPIAGGGLSDYLRNQLKLGRSLEGTELVTPLDEEP